MVDIILNCSVASIECEEWAGIMMPSPRASLNFPPFMMTSADPSMI